MNKIIIVIFVLFVVTSADEKGIKYTQIVQPASRQPQQQQQHYGYQADAIYPAQNVPYQMAHQAANEGIYQPAIDHSNSDTQSHHPEQALDNQSFDPNLYSNFVPQDSVQQYVSPYGGPYAPGGADAIGYPIPYGGGPYGGGYGPNGFALQTGYEGFLVPSIPAPPPPPPGFGGFLDYFRTFLYRRTVMSMLMRSDTYILNSLGVILFACAVTTALCSFTSLCTITFAALPLLGLREGLSTKTIKESISGELTPERVKRTAEFVLTALEKYNQITGDTPKESKNDVASSSSVRKASETN